MLSAPAPIVEPLGEGVWIQLHDDPFAWVTDEYEAVENAVLDHLGRDCFFDANDPDRPTRAPEWPPSQFPAPPGPPPKIQTMPNGPGKPWRVFVDGEEVKIPRK